MNEKKIFNENISSDIIELSSDQDGEELNLRPSKPKQRPKHKVKVLLAMTKLLMVPALQKSLLTTLIRDNDYVSRTFVK